MEFLAAPGIAAPLSPPTATDGCKGLGDGTRTMETGYESEAKAVQRDPRAAARTAPARQAAPPTTGERLVRRRRTADPFAFDQRIIPHGVSYEWKRESVFGEQDVPHKIEMRENHWRAVPASRHPELAVGDDSVIRRGGTVLCERPKYLTEEAQMEDIGEALKPIQGLEQIMYGTKPGELTRDHPSVRKVSSVRQQWAPGPPVEEAGGGEAPGLEP